jgi:hypothetical protein
MAKRDEVILMEGGEGLKAIVVRSVNGITIEDTEKGVERQYTCMLEKDQNRMGVVEHT